MSKKPFFTIITVTYNAGYKVSKTIKSVYEQSCTDYEYILIDGASNDDTVKRIADYQSTFSKCGISYRFITESDNGIYDAMNKGISLANGRWVSFMNAGDQFFNSESLDTIKKAIERISKVDVVYGDTIEFKSNGLSIYRKAIPIDQIVGSIPFFHQSCVTKLDLLKRFRFDQRYRLCADYDFFLSCYQNKAKFMYLNVTVSRYEYGGVSSCDENAIQLLRDQLEVRKKHGIIDDEEYQKKKGELKKKAKCIVRKNIIKKRIPNAFYQKIRYYYDIRKGWKQEF